MGIASNNGRFAELDALRAGAVMLVVWSHTANTALGYGEFNFGGYHGVLLFFVVSGFLITGILLDARAVAARLDAPRGTILRAFYARRLLRIVPVYYLVLLLAAVINVPTVRHALGWHASYLTNWYFTAQGRFDPPTAHLWSLAVEEQFYLVWPWFALLLPSRALVRAMVAMTLTGLLSRFGLAWLWGDGLAVWITTPTTLDSLGLGCLLAYAWRNAGSPDGVARWAGIAGLSLMIGQQVMSALDAPPLLVATLRPFSWSLICVWMVHRAARGVGGWAGRLMRARPIVYVGTISYGIYLVHMFVPPTMRRLGRLVDFVPPRWMTEGYSGFVIVSAITIAAAALSWRYFEAPLNALKRRYPYVKETAPAGQADRREPCESCGHALRASDRACPDCGVLTPALLN